MKEKKELIPKRRFKEFENSDAWEQCKLLDSVIKVIDFRGRTPKKLGLDWSEEGYLALSALNVKNGYIDKLVDAHYGNRELYNEWMSGNELHQGQVLFTTEAPMGNVAQVPDNKQYILSQRTIAFEVDERIITENYLAVVLGSPKIFDRLTALSSGGTAKGVSQKSLSKLFISIPNNTEEQIKVGTFFRNLDNLITFHQRKLKKVQKLKKAYLSEMFPKEGEKYPRLRFVGYTDAWGQCKLGDVADIRSGRDYKHLLEGDIPVYGTGGYMLSVNEALSYKQDAIGIGRKGTINKPYILRAPFWTVDTLFYAIPEVNTNLDFIYGIFQNIKWKQKDESTGVPSLSKVVINNINVLIPEHDEQSKIGAFFRNLDKLITLHQRKLEKLENIKKAYLNEMFI